jgi:hypothetical protein
MKSRRASGSMHAAFLSLFENVSAYRHVAIRDVSRLTRRVDWANPL